MFCLRTWISLLLFLQNASPLYIILFLTATYALQRPCVYCSILLFVLVFSLFDFEGEWFETHLKPSTTSQWLDWSTKGNTTIGEMVSEVLSEGASLALCAVNGTAESTSSVAVDGVKRRMGLLGGRYGGEAAQNGFEILRAGLEKWQFRIPCVDVIVRL